MKRFFNIKIFLIAFFLFAFLIPVFANAAGLVPCGGCKVDFEVGSDGKAFCPDPEDACTLCHFFVVIDNIIDFFLSPTDSNGGFPIVALIAVAMVAWAGVKFMFAYMGGGGPNEITSARNLLYSVLVGLLIIYGAWILVNTVLSLAGIVEWTGLVDNPSTPETERWYQINCPLGP